MTRTNSAVKTVVILALSMTLAALSGCASMNSSFDCPMKSGNRCQSLDQVNASVDQGEFAEKMPNAPKTDSANVHLVRIDALTTSDTPSAMPKRHQEAVQRIWVAPFEDSEGSYHGASEVFAVMQTGQWDPHLMTRPLSESV